MPGHRVGERELVEAGWIAELGIEAVAGLEEETAEDVGGAVGVELAGSPRVFQRARLEGQRDRAERDELGAAARGGLVDLDHDVALSREPDLADQSLDDGGIGSANV